MHYFAAMWLGYSLLAYSDPKLYCLRYTFWKSPKTECVRDSPHLSASQLEMAANLMKKHNEFKK